VRVTPAYFDTSVLVKRYVREPASPRARELLRRYRFVSSAVAPVEATSAIRRRTNIGELTDIAMRAVLRRMAEDRMQWELLEVGTAVLSRAESLASQLGIAALDAIHVASAMTFVAALGWRTPFITADARQREAARSVNLDVVWVG
jgi:predicted nucleic acid-binding protein